MTERETIATFTGVQVAILPRRWQDGGGTPAKVIDRTFKISFRGADLDPASTARWAGRVDLFANRPFASGDIVSIDAMRAVHARRNGGTESRRYLRLRPMSLLEKVYWDDSAEQLCLTWVISEYPIVDERAVWRADLDNRAVHAALLVTPTRPIALTRER